MNWLAKYNITKKVSLLPYRPASHLERNFLMRCKNYKRIHLPPQLHKPIAQQSGISIPLLKKVDVVGAYYVSPCGFDCVTTERLCKNGMQKYTPSLEAQTHEAQGKIFSKRSSKKITAPVSIRQSSRQSN